MRSASFAVNLASRPLDETTLSWPDHAVRIVSARALLLDDLTGTDPAWIHIAGGGNVASFLFHPPCAAGSRRVAHTLDQLPIVLEARQELKVWGVRAGGGGIFRVEVEFVRPRRSRPVECAVAAAEPNLTRLAPRAGTW